MNTRNNPHVAIIFTGGTIASKLDEAFGGIVPTLSANQILEAVPNLEAIANIETYEYGKFPGPHITPERMLEIAGIVREFVERRDIDGVVVTHGTDTLEETAFFLDCVINSEKPIVVVGAMRNSSEPDWDGPRNLRDAIIIAANKNFRGMGTLVCLAGVVNAASEVSKTDTEEVNAFRSFDFGPIARITNGNAICYRKPLHREHIPTSVIPSHVPIIKCYAGMPSELLEKVLDGVNGIVVEALGVGNVPPAAFYPLVNAAKNDIPVVLVSRCPVGRTEAIYAYEGAGRHLHDAGVIFADFLNGQKARIKLLCAIGAGRTTHQIRKLFEWAG